MRPRILDCREIESRETKWIREFGKRFPPREEDWFDRRDRLRHVLAGYAKEEGAFPKGESDFFVGDEWEGANYLPVVAVTWKCVSRSVVQAIQNYLNRIGGDYLVSVVRPFPVELWGLVVLITARETCIGCLDDSPEKIRAIGKKKEVRALLRLSDWRDGTKAREYRRL